MHPLVEYFRCPETHAVVDAARDLCNAPEFFRFGAARGYGQLRAGIRHDHPDGLLDDIAVATELNGGALTLPFDLSEVVGNLRYERYPEAQRAVSAIAARSMTRSVYYALRPLLPVGVRKHLQRFHWRGWQEIDFPHWPVDTSVEDLMRAVVGLALEQGALSEFPFIWFWPEGAPACVMMTHDVEGPTGAAFCERLMDIDAETAMRSSFQIVPEAPWASSQDTRKLVERLRARGFEVNVHDLNHDGGLFRDRERFLRHAAVINARSREFGGRGFRAGAMYRRQDWLEALDISYDMSVPNVAHLEPQRGGCCTVMPYFNGHVLELPLTTAQDYTIFHVLGDYSTTLWQEQIAHIVAANGLISMIAHPDYLAEPRAWSVYQDLLRLLTALRSEHRVWIAPPAEIDRWWRERSEMRLERDGATWCVRGPGSERARVAWVKVQDDRVVYDVAPSRRAA